MVKAKTVETIEEYDENGKLVKKTTTEKEKTDDFTARYLSPPASPYDDMTWKEYVKHFGIF